MHQHNPNGGQPQLIVLQQQDQPAPQPLQEAHVPPRVMVAMEFLQRLTHKTAAKAVPGPVASTEMDGQRLTIEEEQAQASALALLTQYFGGGLKRCRWDVPQSAEARKPLRIPCPVCKGRDRAPDGSHYHCTVRDSQGEVTVGRARP